MNNIVKDIIQYINTQNPDIIIKKTNIDNISELNSACFELLAWLKLERKRELWISEGKKTCLKPLKLNKEYSWCVLLMQIIENEKLFAEAFEIIDSSLVIRTNLSPADQSQIREDAFQLYNPQPIIN